MTLAGEPWLTSSIDDRSRLISMPWGRVFVVDVGPVDADEPPIVLLHGLLTTHYVYDLLIPRLAMDRRVIALDLPGAGDSDRPAPARVDGYSVPWLSEAVQQAVAWLGCETVDLAGHDFGGALAVHWAACQPDRIRRLTLLAPTLLAGTLPLTGTLGFVPTMGPEVFRRVVRRLDVQRFLELGVATPDMVMPSEIDVYWDKLARFGGPEACHAMLSQLAALVRLRGLFAQVVADTVVVWGQDDRVVPMRHGERLATLLPHAQLERFEGGHTLVRERPEAIARLIERSHHHRNGDLRA